MNNVVDVAIRTRNRSTICRAEKRLAFKRSYCCFVFTISPSNIPSSLSFTPSPLHHPFHQHPAGGCVVVYVRVTPVTASLTPLLSPPLLSHLHHSSLFLLLLSSPLSSPPGSGNSSRAIQGAHGLDGKPGPVVSGSDSVPLIPPSPLRPSLSHFLSLSPSLPPSSRLACFRLVCSALLPSAAHLLLCLLVCVLSACLCSVCYVSVLSACLCFVCYVCVLSACPLSVWMSGVGRGLL